MTFAFEQTAEIEVPPHALWQVLVDPSVWPAWFPFARRAVVEGGMVAGGRIAVELEISRERSFRLALTLCRIDFERRLAWSARVLGLHAEHVFLLEPSLRGVRLVSRVVLPGLLAGLVPRRLLRRLEDEGRGMLARLAQAAQDRLPRDQTAGG